MECIAYYRVSTDKQGASGLGLEAQRDAVQRHVATVGGSIQAEFVEIESGKRADRPELARAIRAAKRSKATLYVAKLDRLARNVAFVSALMESGVDFVACDNPHANRLTIQILAAVAEHEARACSERTKAALAAYKARGGVLGANRENHPPMSRESILRGARASGAASVRRMVDAYAEETPIIQSMHASGSSFQAIADRLNSEGYRTIQGKEWTKSQAFRALRRAEAPSLGA